MKVKHALDSLVNAIMNGFYTVRGTASLVGTVIAELGPGRDTRKEVVRLARDIPLNILQLSKYTHVSKE